jgi:hypothetical protein
MKRRWQPLVAAPVFLLFLTAESSSPTAGQTVPPQAVTAFATVGSSLDQKSGFPLARE